MHKELAHSQVVKAYHSVHSLKGTKAKNRTFIIVGLIAILLSLVVVVQPGIIGFTLVDPVLPGNNPPEWIGEKVYNIDGVTMLDLKYRFRDADNDQLTFLATSEPGLEVKIVQNKVVIYPTGKGVYTIMLIASDGFDTAKTDITVFV